MSAALGPRRHPAAAALAAGLVMLAASLLPIRMVLGEPALRLATVAAPPGVAAALPHPATHLGVRWTGDHDDRLAARWRGAGGDPWSPWSPVEVAHDLGDEAAGRVLSGLLLAGGATEAEVRVDAGSPQGIELVAIDAEHGPSRLVVAHATRPAGAYNPVPRVPPPPVISRTQWGADESIRRPEISFAPPVRMVVHHTVTTTNDPNPAATVRAIYGYHVLANGWNDIGYNFLIDAQGRVYEGRWARGYAPGEVPTGEDIAGRGVTGAHAEGNNTGTVGVALLGDFTAAPPTPAALDSLQRLLAWKADRHDIDALGAANWTTGVLPTIVGHRDVGATACPGDRFHPLLPAVRRAVAQTVATARAKPRVAAGYWMLGADTTVYPFGEGEALGPVAGSAPMRAPAASIAATPSGKGLWVLSSGGQVTAFGDAGWYGSTEAMALNAPAVRLEPTTTGRGYWILGRDGGVFSFGDAAFHGSTGDLRLNAPVISMTATPSGLGYWLLAADGGVFTFGDGGFFGSTGDLTLNAPVVSMAPHPSGRGYWLQAADGGIFSFGQVGFHGSVPELGLAGVARSVQIRAAPGGKGYYVLGADGGIFAFGELQFHGARPGLAGPQAAVDLTLLVRAAD